jgi:hypothetical protein
MFKQIMIEANNCDVFQETGFHVDISANPYRIQFDEEKLRGTPTFREMWSLGLLPGQTVGTATKGQV